MKRIIHHNQRYLSPKYARMVQHQKVSVTVHHISRLKWKNNMIISKLPKKAFDKTNTHSC